MGRLSKYFEREIARFPGRDPWPFKLTPAMWREWREELPSATSDVYVANDGRCFPLQRIELHTRPIGDNVILMGRDDLFLATDDDDFAGVQVFSENSVTSIPDNIGCCEVLAVAELVTNVKPGEVYFIDFFRVKQPYIVQTEELYIAGSDAFDARFDPKTGTLHPLDNVVITKRASDRFKVAMNGTDRVDVPAYTLTEGIAGGKNSHGHTSSHILYQEVVEIGKLTHRPRPGVMTKVERALLDSLAGDSWGLNQELWDAFREERERGRTPDIAPGELVMFCSEIATQVRVRGEQWSIIPYDNVHSVIDDARILDEAVRGGRAGRLVSLSP